MVRTVDSTMATQTKFAHFVLRVSSMARSVAWYRTVLNMQVVYQNPMLTFLTYDDEHHRLALVQSQMSPEESAGLPGGAPGLDHVAYTLPSLEQLLATYKRLKEAEILTVWPINHGLTTSMYYADPDGNRVEFQVENMTSKEELQGYMRSEAFAENPIGVTFDPEELLVKFENGEPIETLLKQAAS